MSGDLDSILFDLGKIIEGATEGDRSKVAAYAVHLSDKLESAGEMSQAKKFRKLIQSAPGGKFELAYAKSASQEVAPVDLDSNLSTADIETPKAEQVQLFLPPDTQTVVDNFVTYVKSADKLRAKGVGISASMLIYGPPGCGKTQLARWIAAKLSLPLITARADGLISSYLGSTAKNIRQLFQFAMSRPSVLFLDEFDSIAKMRDDAGELGELKRVVISLLQNIDAMNKDHVLIAATNHEHLLDKAIWRRFGYSVHLREPIEDVRRQMLNTFLGEYATDDVVDILLALSDGLTGANLRTISEECIRRAIIDNHSTVSLTDAARVALDNHPVVVAGTSIPEQARALRKLNPRAFTESRLGKIFGKSQPQMHRYLQESIDATNTRALAD
jgi:MoxR-like ATPase